MNHGHRRAGLSLVLLFGLSLATIASAQEGSDAPPPPPPPTAPVAPEPPAPPIPPTEHDGAGHAEHGPAGSHGGGHHMGRGSDCCGGYDAGNPRFGGLGYAFGGLMMGSFRGLEGALSSPSNLGPGYGVSTGGLTFGGGGGALLFGRLWIGGKGYGLTLGTGVTPSGSASLFGGGGGFELGVAAVNHARWLVIPYVGLGAFGYSLTVNNATGAAFKLSPNDTVPARGSQDFTAGSATGEVGLRVMRLLFSGSGGFAAGAEVGYMSALGRDAWKGPEKVNTGLEAADMGAAYVRLIVGGGGFFGRKSE